MPNYRAYMIGRIWQPIAGPCGTHRDFEAPSDKAAVEAVHKDQSGDFMSLDDFKLIKWVPCGECGRPKPIIVRQWLIYGQSELAEDIERDGEEY